MQLPQLRVNSTPASAAERIHAARFQLHWQVSPANTGGLHLNDYILAVDLRKNKSVFFKLHTLRRGAIPERRQ
jgi:hypothetical protein